MQFKTVFFIFAMFAAGVLAAPAAEPDADKPIYWYAIAHFAPAKGSDTDPRSPAAARLSMTGRGDSRAAAADFPLFHLRPSVSQIPSCNTHGGPTRLL